MGRVTPGPKDPQKGDTQSSHSPHLVGSPLEWEPWIVTLESPHGDSGGVKPKVTMYGCSKKLAQDRRDKATGCLPES